MAYVIVLAVIVLVSLIVSAASVKIVRPYQRGLVERLGRYHGTVEPGLRIIVPGIDRMIRVDMRESVVEVPAQEVITSDNVVVTVYAVVYYEATDPQRLMFNVADFMKAVTKLAQTNLRNVIGDMQLDEALTASQMVNARLRDILDDATDKWGARVVRVEIQRIDPPEDVVQAMHIKCGPNAPVAPWSPRPPANGRRPWPGPRATATPPSWRRKAPGSGRCSRRRARPTPCGLWPTPSGTGN